MPSDERTVRINQAVETILEHCALHGVGVLQSCLDGLARKPVWSKEEIEVVRKVVEAQLTKRSP